MNRRRVAVAFASGVVLALVVARWLDTPDERSEPAAPASVSPRTFEPEVAAPRAASSTAPSARPASAQAEAPPRVPSDLPEPIASAPRPEPRVESQPSPEREARATQAESVPRIFTDLVVAADAPTAQVQGLDPLGPRALVAWRVHKGRAAVLAYGESDRGGTLHFPSVVVPGNGLEVVVTAADTGPEDPGASTPRTIPPRPPAPPYAAHVETVDREHFLRIFPAEATGEILLADDRGEVFARYDIPVRPSAAARVIDVAVTLPPYDTGVLLAHRFADGRRSAWSPLTLVDAEAEDPADE